MALSPKHKSFVQHYLKHKNAAEAARAAGYSAKTAKTAGSRMLTFVDVKRAIEKGLEAQSKRLEISADKVIQRIAEIALDKKAKATHKDVLKGCELLGKHFKIFTEVVESNVTATVSTVTPEEARATYLKIKNDC